MTDKKTIETLKQTINYLNKELSNKSRDRASSEESLLTPVFITALSSEIAAREHTSSDRTVKDTLDALTASLNEADLILLEPLRKELFLYVYILSESKTNFGAYSYTPLFTLAFQQKIKRKVTATLLREAEYQASINDLVDVIDEHRAIIHVNIEVRDKHLMDQKDQKTPKSPEQKQREKKTAIAKKIYITRTITRARNISREFRKPITPFNIRQKQPLDVGDIVKLKKSSFGKPCFVKIVEIKSKEASIPYGDSLPYITEDKKEDRYQMNLEEFLLDD